jgi:hypothetical protein
MQRWCKRTWVQNQKETHAKAGLGQRELAVAQSAAPFSQSSLFSLSGSAREFLRRNEVRALLHPVNTAQRLPLPSTYH